MKLAALDLNGSAGDKLGIGAVRKIDTHLGAQRAEAEHADEAFIAAAALEHGDVVFIVPGGKEVIFEAEVIALYFVQPAHELTKVAACAAADGVLFKQARQVDVFKFLPGVDKRRAFEKVEESGVIDKVALARDEGADARLVVVLKAAQLVVVRGVDGLLKVQHIEIVREGDLADLKVKSCDIEAWSPRQQKYFEVCSCSNLGDAQARRLHIRIKGKDGKNYLAHTLNNTCVAPPRMLIAFLENNLQPDGSVVIPAVLRPYMGGKEVLVPKH